MPEKKTWDRSQDYAKFQSSDKAKKDRAARNKARREALRKGLVKKGDGMEIHHKNSDPQDNRPSNRAIITRKANRTEANRKKK